MWISVNFRRDICKAASLAASAYATLIRLVLVLISSTVVIVWQNEKSPNNQTNNTDANITTSQTDKIMITLRYDKKVVASTHHVIYYAVCADT